MLHQESARSSEPLIVPFRVDVCAGGTLGSFPDEIWVVTTVRLETNQEMPDKRSATIANQRYNFSKNSRWLVHPVQNVTAPGIHSH
jgi:hypothetical protein